MDGQVVTHLLLSIRVILHFCLEEGPLVICVVIYPFTEMIPKIKASAKSEFFRAAFIINNKLVCRCLLYMVDLPVVITAVFKINKH